MIQLLKDFENVEAVNTQLERMYVLVAKPCNEEQRIVRYFAVRGASMGSRMIEEFLAKISLGICSDFKETMEVLSKVRHSVILDLKAR